VDVDPGRRGALSGKRAPKRGKATPKAVERDYRMWEAVELYKRGGSTEAEIAEKLGVSQKTISRDLERARAELLRKTTAGADEMRAAAYGRLEAVIREAYAGFERSKVQRLRREQATHSSPGRGKNAAALARTDARVVSEDRDGEPRWLAVIVDAIDKQAKMLDLYPRKSGDDAPGGGDASEVDPRFAGDVILIPVVEKS
jgi:hypothetical protein